MRVMYSNLLPDHRLQFSLRRSRDAIKSEFRRNQKITLWALVTARTWPLQR